MLLDKEHKRLDREKEATEHGGSESIPKKASEDEQKAGIQQEQDANTDETDKSKSFL